MLSQRPRARLGRIQCRTLLLGVGRVLFGVVRVTRVTPSSALVPFVRAFEIIESDTLVVRTLLPDTCLALAFRYSGSATLLNGAPPRLLPDAALTGLRSSARQMQTSAGGGIIVAKLVAGGAASFFREPLHPLFGQCHPLSEHLPRIAVERTEHAIKAATSIAERVALLEHFLLAQQGSTEPDAVIGEALRAISADPSAVRVAELARSLHLSQDAFEKRFRRVVGTSPKRFASIVRLQKAIAGYRPETTLTQLAIDSGYYDQSHFVRQFQAAAGTAPGRFFRFSARC
jgi:AraC-like DNA-binding protein